MARSERDKIIVADLVRDHRLRLGLTVAALARALGVHPITVRRWEAGIHQPHELWLRRLAAMEPDAPAAPIEVEAALGSQER